MKIISWNVNGLRAVLNKGFLNFFNEVDADIFCIQHTKICFRKGQKDKRIFIKDKSLLVCL